MPCWLASPCKATGTPKSMGIGSRVIVTVIVIVMIMTKVLVVGKDAAEQSANAVITIRGEVLEVVSYFKYLFHVCCLRRICGISLFDNSTNSVILKRCETFSVESQLRSRRLRWFGHNCRMSDSRLPKVLMHGQLVGQSCHGRPRTVWNDVVSFDIHKLKLHS